MSVILPFSPDDAKRWAARDAKGEEPVALSSSVLSSLGWSAPYEWARSTSQPNLRTLIFDRRVQIPGLENTERPDDRVDIHRIELSRWWDRPLSPGGPMQTASTRTVMTEQGRTLEVVTTSHFEGSERVVDVVFVSGSDWSARVVFSRAPPNDVDAIVQSIQIR